jgi:hypothetical protein
MLFWSLPVNRALYQYGRSGEYSLTTQSAKTMAGKLLVTDQLVADSSFW